MERAIRSTLVGTLDERPDTGAVGQIFVATDAEPPVAYMWDGANWRMLLGAVGNDRIEQAAFREIMAGNITVGTVQAGNSPGTPLGQLAVEMEGTAGTIAATTWGTADCSEVALVRYGGDKKAPASVVAGDVLGRVSWSGYDGSDIRSFAEIKVEIGEESGTPATVAILADSGTGTPGTAATFRPDESRIVGNLNVVSGVGVGTPGLVAPDGVVVARGFCDPFAMITTTRHCGGDLRWAFMPCMGRMGFGNMVTGGTPYWSFPTGSGLGATSNQAVTPSETNYYIGGGPYLTLSGSSQYVYAENDAWQYIGTLPTVVFGWFYMNSGTAPYKIAAKRDWTSNVAWSIEYLETTGVLRFGVSETGNASASWKTVDTPVSLMGSVWYFAAGVFWPSTGLLIFLGSATSGAADTLLVNSNTSAPFASVYNSSALLTLGAAYSSGSPSGFLAGRLGCWACRSGSGLVGTAEVGKFLDLIYQSTMLAYTP